MIKRKTKFIQTGFETEELGARNGLMQEAGSPPTASTGAILPKGLTRSEVLEIKIKNIEGSIEDINEWFDNPVVVKGDKGHEKEEKASPAKIESAKIILENLMKEKQVLIQAKAELDKTEMTIKAEKDIAGENLDAAKKNKEAAEAGAKGQVEIAKLEQKSREISPVESDLFSLIKKYDILNNPKAFQDLVEKSKGDNSDAAKIIQADAQRIEQDLKDLKLGKFVKTDGIIEQSELDAITADVSKKMAALIKFKESTGIDLISPTAGGSKPVIEKEKH